MTIRNLAVAIAVLISGNLAGQIGSEGTPLSWTLGGEVANNTIWEVLEPLNSAVLIAEDAANQSKSLPYRFAEAQLVHFDPSTSGQWTNLANGDRIWKLGIRCQSAFSLSVTFENFTIPRGAKMYIYNGDQTDYIGPLTERNNRVGAVLGTLPIRGTEVVVEYYEPFSKRGDGQFFISSVARAYRDLTLYPDQAEGACMDLLQAGSNERGIDRASSAVMMMLTDNCQRMATAVLLNNTGMDATMYAMTVSSSLMGDLGAMVFVLDFALGECGSASACWNKALSGAEVIKSDTLSSLSLLRLIDRPRSQWSTYLAGWNVSALAPGDFYSIGHGLTCPQSISSFNGTLVPAQWNGYSSVEFSQWNDGGLFQGAVGSPLFNGEGEVIGIYVGGNGNCDSSNDYFILLSECWPAFKSFLDPFDSGYQLQGAFAAGGTTINNELKDTFLLYPNPTKNNLNILNNSGKQILSWSIADGYGRIVARSSFIEPFISVSELAQGLYFLTISQEEGNEVRTFMVR